MICIIFTLFYLYYIIEDIDEPVRLPHIKASILKAVS
jgi:hypothetical protein